jgi:hypothetical protein
MIETLFLGFFALFIICAVISWSVIGIACIFEKAVGIIDRFRFWTRVPLRIDRNKWDKSLIVDNHHTFFTHQLGLHDVLPLACHIVEDDGRKHVLPLIERVPLRGPAHSARYKNGRFDLWILSDQLYPLREEEA